MAQFTEILLWLFVMNIGIAFGAGFYEARIIVPQWASSPPESTYQPDTGRKFWAFITTGPLTILTLASLVAAWQYQGVEGRDWWLGAAVAVIVERIMTFSYFIPTMVKLQRAENLSESKAKAMISQWMHINYIRLAIDLAAWVAALQAFSLLI